MIVVLKRYDIFGVLKWFEMWFWKDMIFWYIKMIWNEVLKDMIFLILNDLNNGVWKIGHFDINMI